eukprot:13239-Heterococcus_DN1.PRE.5
MHSELEDCEFESVLVADPDRNTMVRALHALAQKVQKNPGCTALIYYAGHGAVTKFSHKHVLMGKGWQFEGSEDLTVDLHGCILEDYLSPLGDAQAIVILMNACRTNVRQRSADAPAEWGSRSTWFQSEGSYSSKLMHLFNCDEPQHLWHAVQSANEDVIAKTEGLQQPETLVKRGRLFEFFLVPQAAPVMPPPPVQRLASCGKCVSSMLTSPVCTGSLSRATQLQKQPAVEVHQQRQQHKKVPPLAQQQTSIRSNINDVNLAKSASKLSTKDTATTSSASDLDSAEQEEDCFMKDFDMSLFICFNRVEVHS